MPGGHNTPGSPFPVDRVGSGPAHRIPVARAAARGARAVRGRRVAGDPGRDPERRDGRSPAATSSGPRRRIRTCAGLGRVAGGTRQPARRPPAPARSPAVRARRHASRAATTGGRRHSAAGRPVRPGPTGFGSLLRSTSQSDRSASPTARRTAYRDPEPPRRPDPALTAVTLPTRKPHPRPAQSATRRDPRPARPPAAPRRAQPRAARDPLARGGRVPGLGLGLGQQIVGQRAQVGLQMTAERVAQDRPQVLGQTPRPRPARGCRCAA